MSLIALPDGSVRPEVLADPYELYAQLRANTPVLFDPAVNGWLVSRYDDVRALARDERLLARRSQSYFRGLPPHERTRFPLFMLTRNAMLLYMDGPAHARVRRVIAEAVRGSVAALGTALVLRHVEALVAQIATSRRQVDLVRDLAEPLPRAVLTDLLGLPHDEAAKIYQQSVAFNTVLAGVIDARRVENAERALRELRPSLSRLAVDPPPRSILARLRSAVVTGDLTEDELVASAVTLVAAGHETTTNLIANTLVALAGNPSVQDLAISSDVAAGRVVDEVLRFDAPVQLTAREASEDLVVAHEAISHGDRVVLLWGSANRDPATFQCPDAFDPGRPERLSALSFGVGPHHCPGSGLARMQAAMAVRALLQAVGPIRLSQEPSWRNSFAFRGPATLIAHRCRRLSADAGRTRSGRLT